MASPIPAGLLQEGQLPKVSIILTSYNHARFLRAAIDSVLAQSFSDFELIIWDDASTDASWEIIQSYADPRIRAFRNPRRERSVYSINRALSEAATGELIAIHHSDDVWLPGKLAAQVSFLDSHPQVWAVFTRARIIDERGNRFAQPGHFYARIFEQPNRTRHEWLNFFFFNGNALCHPSVLIRKAFYDKYGLYGGGFTQLTDLDAWIRLCLHHDIHVLQEELVEFRVRDGMANASTMPDSAVRSAFEWLQIARNYLQVTDFEEMAAIFPQARKYYRPDYFDARFVLAMMALQAQASPPMRLFGLDLLFEALRDPPRAAKLKEMYGFDLLRFHDMKGANEVFADGAMQARLEAIERNIGWRLLERLRPLRERLAPPGSAREKIWYAALRPLRPRR